MEKQKILIVEDNESFLTTLTLFLEQSDYDVATASNMDKAIQLLGSKRFDILLLDLKVGNRSAEEIFYFLGISLIPEPKKIIVMTGNPEPLANNMLASVTATLILKPFTFENLLNALRAD